MSQLRQGKISKWFSGLGQEAISVGVAAAMPRDKFIFPMHRNLGIFTTRDVPLDRLFAQFQGKDHGFTKGRDRSFHFGSPEHHIVGMISHLGPQLGLADGVALAEKLDGTGGCSFVFTGTAARRKATSTRRSTSRPCGSCLSSSASKTTPGDCRHRASSSSVAPTSPTRRWATASLKRTPSKSTATTSSTCTTRCVTQLNLCANDLDPSSWNSRRSEFEVTKKRPAPNTTQTASLNGGRKWTR